MASNIPFHNKQLQLSCIASKVQLNSVSIQFVKLTRRAQVIALVKHSIQSSKLICTAQVIAL